MAHTKQLYAFQILFFLGEFLKFENQTTRYSLIECCPRSGGFGLQDLTCSLAAAANACPTPEKQPLLQLPADLQVFWGCQLL